MIPVTQTKVVVKNKNGDVVVRGNCYAAAIASMLELPIDEVPNVEVLFGIDDYSWAAVMHSFLEHKGFELYTNDDFRCFHDKPWLSDKIDYCKDKYYLVSGDSPRGVKHITIWMNGKMEHDPHPSRDGILTLEIFEELVKKNP